jgi:hypothetical protein
MADNSLDEDFSEALSEDETLDLPSAEDVASYVADLVHGLRHMVQQCGGRDLRLLDYMLAITEEEAKKVASNVYH